MPPRGFFLLLLTLPLYATLPSASDLARQVEQSSLDPDECYRVLELNFSKEDLKIYLTSGYLAFAKPINGVRHAAVFTSQVEGGDAEMLLLPPLRSERLSLANFTDSPNLDEHFKTSMLLFTDGTAADLMAHIRDAGARKAPEMGALLSDQWNGTIRNLAASFETRIVNDLLTDERKSGFFYMAVSGGKLGNFDVVYDPKSRDQVTVGQIAYRNNSTFFDVWTSFRGRSHGAAGTLTEPSFVLDNYRIDSTIQPDLVVRAITRATLVPRQKLGRCLQLYISHNMRVTEVKVDGQPMEIFDRESLRSNLIRGSDNAQFLAVAAADLDSSKPHELEIHHEGAVISKAGDRVYFVTSRGTWYPRAGFEFARYDLTFRYPKDLELVSTGETLEDHTEGEYRVTRHKSESPVRFAGFNLGDFESVAVHEKSFKVRVYANRRLEAALQPKLRISEPVDPPPVFQRRRPNTMPPPDITPPTTPRPTARLEEIAHGVSEALDFLTDELGPPPIHSLTVAPIPGTFGQGFPGLIYLSTLAYLDPSQRPPAVRNRYQTTFFSELLEAHEVAHQWWGNLVTPAGYQDEWLMEALSNYCAVLMLEKKKGVKVADAVLADYKTNLLKKTGDGRTFESSGPITWGYRLRSSEAPDAWRAITYEKGAWIIHMLRRRLGDEKFRTMLREICERYRFSPISTEEFREIAERYAPAQSAGLNGFFDTWVYGTGIPTVKLNYSMKGLKLTGTLSQSDVAEDFSAYVPVEVQIGRQKSVYWLATGSDPVPFSITLKQRPTRVALLTSDSLITQR